MDTVWPKIRGVKRDHISTVDILVSNYRMLVMGEFHRDNDEIDIGPGDHRGRIGVSRDTIGLAGGFRRRLA